MALFQSSVLKANLETQDKAIIKKAYTVFKKCFFNPIIQENIRKNGDR